jgi:hypothetical protein
MNEWTAGRWCGVAFMGGEKLHGPLRSDTGCAAHLCPRRALQGDRSFSSEEALDAAGNSGAHGGQDLAQDQRKLRNAGSVTGFGTGATDRAAGASGRPQHRPCLAGRPDQHGLKP